MPVCLSLCLSVCLAVAVCNKLKCRNYCSIMTGDISNCSYRLSFVPLTYSHLSSAYNVLLARKNGVTARAFSWSPATRRNCDNPNCHNCGPSGDRWNQNGEKQQIKTATTTVYTLAVWKSGFSTWRVWHHERSVYLQRFTIAGNVSNRGSFTIHFSSNVGSIHLACLHLPTLRLLDGVSVFFSSPKSPSAETEISVFWASTNFVPFFGPLCDIFR